MQFYHSYGSQSLGSNRYIEVDMSCPHRCLLSLSWKPARIQRKYLWRQMHCTWTVFFSPRGSRVFSPTMAISSTLGKYRVSAFLLYPSSLQLKAITISGPGRCLPDSFLIFDFAIGFFAEKTSVLYRSSHSAL